MHPILKTTFILLCASGFTFFVGSAQTAQAYQTSQAGGAGNGSTTAQSDVRTLLETARCQQGCHDCWYELFPGAVNYCLGMRDWGKGSYRDGLRLLKLAAGWGNKNAQYTLGMIYFKGRHVASDRARGMAWLMLANERHNDKQTDLVIRSAVHLATPEQYKRAQRLLREMRKKYGDKVARVRAWHHLRNRLKSYQTGSFTPPRTSCILEDGGVVPWSSGLSADPHALCLPSDRFTKSVARIASEYFGGLRGTVTVGPLQQIPAPASSSRP